MKKNLPKLFEIHSIFNESKIMWFKTLLIAVILAMSGNVYSQVSEVVVPFNPRTSSYTPNQTIYHVKGDFTMLGNTNLILDGYYPDSIRNNNNNDVIFVDIDNDPSTVNSSSATLVLSEENGATPECSNIIYAGLYWSGRTQRNDYENTWTTGGSTENVYNNNVINNAYTLNISQNGSWSNDNNRTATYTFTPSGGGDVVTFEFTTNHHSKEVKVSVGGGPATTINASYSSDWNNMTANFETPYIINTGSANIKVNNLRKNTSSNTIDEDFRANVTYGGVILNKQEVLFKAKKGTYSTAYNTVSATNSNILYPQGGAYDQIYVAYAEVTDFVRQNGTAEYTVANIALREGQDDAGRSGGWGLVVVYENSKMKWRDVSIFDGYGYMKSDGHDAYLPVQGFNTVPSGDVNMKLGMMASEGDISAAGDFFAIQKLQSSDYERLNHSENSTDNFFNSSIYTGNNPRNPNITNNIGMDISMFNIPNADKSIIANGQTSTTFKYGTGGDGYVIYSIAMAVDAYVPEPEATVAIESVNSTPPGTEVLPNDIIEYSLEIRNIGTEDIENGKIIIPIPYTAEFVSSSGAFFQGLNGNQPYYDSGEGATGAIVWEFGDMPLYTPTTTLLGKLTFKLKVTTDCFILSNANCSPAVTLDGSISGIGHDSQVAVSNVGFIQGYQTSGSCEGAAIKDPLTMPINAGTYVYENCDGDYSTRDFSYCNFGGSNIPFSDVTANFPAGTRFYNEHPVTSSATEYTNSTGFPGTVGKTYYYAVPPGITACYWQFTITVNDITSTPTANNINYCVGDVATPLTATPSDNSYTLFYYTSATDDTPETSITPSTSTVGTTSYWVAEGLSNQCISPNKVKFEVIVNPLPEPYISGSSIVCSNTTMVYTTPLVTGNTYLWEVSNGKIIGSKTNNTVSILWENEGAGSISVTETTPSACSKTKTLETDVNEVKATEATEDHKDVTCYDGNDGAFTASASGGNGNYTYSLKNDFSNSNTNGKFTGLTAGTYTVYVKDANGCTTSVDVEITQPDAALDASVTSQTNVDCFGNNTASVTVTATGGTTSYKYKLDNGAYQNNGTFNSLKAGNYTVYVKDANGCTTSVDIKITQPDKLTCDANQVSQVTIFGHKDGVATVTPDGGTKPYEYLWDNGDERAKADTLGAGYHEVTVTDANGCETTCQVTIGQPGELTCDVKLIHNVDCNGFANGSAEVTANGGIGSYTYLWDNGDKRTIADTLRAGTHTVTVTDANGAHTKCEVTINEPDEVVIITPKDSSVSSCLTQQEVDTEFATWLSRVKVSGGNKLSVTNDNNGAPLACGGAVTVTWTASSECPEDVQDSAKFTVIADSEKPTFTTPADTTIFADTYCNFDASTSKTGDVTDEADNCSTTGLAATFTDKDTVPGNCDGEKVITRIWTLTDDCGNSASGSQIITVKDTIAPTFTTPADTTIFADTYCNFDASTSKTGDVTDEADNCSTTGLAATFTDKDTVPGNCDGEKVITRIWTLTDDCGNSASGSQIITVKDTIAPTFTTPADTTIFADTYCNFDASTSKTGDVTDEADNCSTTGLAATFTDKDTVPGNCDGEKVITRIWTLTDDCGNSASGSQIITVKDTIAPTFTTPADTTIFADTYCNFDASTSKTGDVTDEADNCSTTGLAATFTDKDTVPGNCDGEKVITRIWTLTDDCGNSASGSQIITVKDTIAPTFTTPADTTIFADTYCNFDASTSKTGDVTDEADNCSTTGLAATFTDKDTVPGNCDGEKVITRIWTLTDDCGNSASGSQIITVKDTIAPTFTTPADTTIFADTYCNFDASTSKTGDVTDEADNCSTTGLAATFTDKDTVPGNCDGEKVITRIWTLTDDCGNSASGSQIITVKDTIAPTFTTPADTTIFADTYCNFDASTSKTGDVTDEADNCSTTGLAATFTDKDTVPGNCDGEKVITRIWTLTDDCGNSASGSQIITVKDTIAPTFTTPADTTIFADTYCNFDASTSKTGDVTDEADNCSTTGLAATFTDKDTVPGNCDGEKVITRIWTLIDGCGNSATDSQIITVKDTIAPTFTTPADTTIFADTYCDFDASTSKTGDVTDEADNCSTTGLAATFADKDTVPGNCDGEKVITRIWTLTDDCGNSASGSQIITVKDTIAPTFTTPADTTIFADTYCDFDASTSKTGDVTDEADNCSTTGLAATFADKDTVPGNCDGEKVITRIWTLIDGCGNSATDSQIITVKDTIAPTFTTPADTTIFADTYCDFDASTSKTGDVTDEADNCSTTGLAATFADKDTVPGNCDGEKVITRIWTLIDGCGNSASGSQIITVKDTIAPTFTTPADTTIFADTYCDFDASTSKTGDVTDEADNCSTTGLAATFADKDTVPGNCDGEKVITRIWTLIDGCGNSASGSQIITVKDTIAPTFTTPADTTIFADTYCDFDASTSKTGDVTDEADNCSTTGLAATFADKDTVPGNCDGEKVITRIWTLIDGCGNSASGSQIITVKDTIAPTFTTPADTTIFADTYCNFDASTSKTGDVTDEADNCSTTGLAATFADKDTVPGNCDGEKVITRIWTLIDGCGNSATDSQIITVKDTIAPTFTTPADTTIFADTYCDFDASTSKTGDVTDEADNCSTTGLAATFADKDTVPGNCDGEKVITRIWTLIDGCGNSASGSQIITVKDTIAPTFTTPADTTIFADTYCDFDASTSKTGDVTDEADNCSTTGLAATFTDKDTVPGNCDGEKVITRIWTLIDGCGNSATDSQIITVKDTIAPTFTTPADTTIFADTYCNFDASTSKTGDVTDEADNCSTTGLAATFTDKDTVPGNCDGEKVITRIWTLTDDCGNSATGSQIITVKDTIAPTFTTPADTTIFADTYCNFDASTSKTGDVTDEADNCSTTGLAATFTDKDTVPGNCDGEKVITRIWTLTDGCGNSASGSQIITVKDTIAPTFTTPADTTIFADTYCDFDASTSKTGDVTDEADNCSTTGLAATFTDKDTVPGNCDGEKVITRIWTLIDGCGNSATGSQIITVKDTIAPTFTTPADTTIFADTYCNFDASTSKTGDVTDEADNCSTTGLAATFTDKDTVPGNCDGEKVITRIWTLTDDCGNSASGSQIITVKDTIAPTFTTPADTTIFADTYCNFDASTSKTGDVTDEADNCSTTGLAATFTDKDTVPGNCDGEKVITRIWTLIDGCGNSASGSQIITVKDTIAPTFTTPADTTIFADTYCDFDASTSKTGDVTDEADNCSTTGLAATFTDKDTVPGNCDGEKVITRIWTLTDDCGNSATGSQIITVKDTIAPTFTTPADTTIFADTYCNFDASTSKTGDVTDEADNCSTTGLAATFTDKDTVPGNCDGEKVITRIWTLIDGCGNSASGSQIITVKDTIAPTFTTPADTTIFADTYCDFDASTSKTGDVTDEADNCSTTGLAATFTDKDTVPGNCDGEKVITRIWTLTDDCGNSATGSQIITVKDTIAPTFTTPADTTIFADTYCNFDASTSKTGDVTDEADNCSTTGLAATFTDKDTVPGNCDGEKVITRIWTLIDGCGNSATGSQIITVKDTIAPTFTTPADTTIFADTYCDFDASTSKTGDVTDEADNCSTTGLAATFTDKDTVPGNCDGEKVITRIWTLIDGCGNSASGSQIITVKDTIAPTFTTPADTTIFADTYCDFDASTSKTGDVTDEADNCSTTGLAATFTDKDTVPGNCDGEKVITRIWTLIDGCGNSASGSQIITVKDTIAPTFTTPADTTIFADTYCDFDASTSKTGDVTDEADNCSTTGLAATFTDKDTVPGNCDGEKVITRIWTLIDGCGNSASGSQIITVKDTIAPTFTTPADTTIFADTYCDFDASTSKTGDVTDEADNCSTTGLAATFTDKDTVPGNCDGEKVITRIWTLIDGCGNSASGSQIITVKDTIAPTFTTPADTTIFADTYCDFDASTSKTGDVTDEADNCSTTGLAATFTDKDTVPGNCDGEKVITRIWTLIDGCGNSASGSQIITVKDTIAPTFTTPADTTIFADTYCDFDASTSKTGDVTDEADNCSTTGLAATFTDKDTVPGNCDGEKVITRIWTLIDGCGNSASGSQIITVKDTIKPVFANIPVATTISCDETVPGDPGTVTASDNCNGDVTASIVFTPGTLVADTNCPNSGIITHKWIVNDGCGNIAEATQEITVTDAIDPTFTTPEDITIYTDAACQFDASVEVTGDVTDEADNCSTDLNATFVDRDTVPGNCEGEKVINRIWTLTDGCGNFATGSQIITVKDTIAPTFNETLPTAEITAECDAVVEAVVLTASDNCDSEVPVVFTETRTDGDCANNYTLTRTWTASDDCGNETSFTQTVVVSDNTAPEVTCNDITVQLDANGAATITVDDINGGTTDACSDIDTMFISQATFDCDNVGENEVTLTVIDECGNASTCTATVTVEEGDADCGLQPFKANDDILTLVYCPDETVSGDLDLFANDEGFTPENVNFTILTDLPEGVSVTDGNLLYANENPTEAVITFTYSVCHTVNTENCSTAEVTIQLLVDTDCDDVPDIDDLDDDDDGILDIIEEENALDQTSLDSDGDGIVDRLDIDADNDGIVDNVEWQSTIAEGGEYDYIFPLGTDSNGDGWDDAYDPASNGITYEPWDMDLDGTPDYLDTNTDNEGEDDNVEGWDEFPNDSIADVSYIGSDADKDGLDDAYDTYNTTTEEWAPGQNAIGSDAYLQDTDNDGVRDWRDAVDDRTPPERFACGDPVIPNAFSPNQDGYNDYFKVMIYCTGTQGGNEERVLGDDFSDARIEIFNRWGNLVYEQERYGNEDYWGDVDAWWNGTSMNDMQVGGNQLPTATYYYILYFNDGNREPITGFVFLNN